MNRPNDPLDERRLSEDCLCVTRLSADGALFVIADVECDEHNPAIILDEPS